MAQVRTVLNSHGMHLMLTSPAMQAEMLRRANKGAEAARADALNYMVTGEYENSITVWVDVTDRAAGRFGSSSDHAIEVEANHGTLARALDAAR